MAIKTRKPIDPAAVEAFGAAADPPAPVAAPPATRSSPEPSVPTSARARPAAPVDDAPATWPRGVARTITLRYADPTLPQLLAEIAALDERSQHKVALRALRRGLDELKREHGL